MNYEKINLEKGMYCSNKSFSSILEELDPSEQYENTPLSKLDAFERQLKRFDIKLTGQGSDTVEKFYSTAQSASLFPEYVTRAIKAGIESANVLPHIIASTTKINSMDYRTISSVPTDAEKSLSVVNEGALIPETAVRTKENLVKLQKRGTMLSASYEAIKFQKLDLFTVTLRQIGAHIARQQFADAINVIINGDGNENPAETISVYDVVDGVSYNDLIGLWNSFDPFELNTIVCAPDVMAKILQMPQFAVPEVGLNFASTGKLRTPLGAKLFKSSAVPEGKLIGLDKRYALEMAVASDVTVEYDKLIDRQLDRAVISTIAGFAKIFDGASKVLA